MHVRDVHRSPGRGLSYGSLQMWIWLKIFLPPRLSISVSKNLAGGLLLLCINLEVFKPLTQTQWFWNSFSWFLLYCSCEVWDLEVHCRTSSTVKEKYVGEANIGWREELPNDPLSAETKRGKDAGSDKKQDDRAESRRVGPGIDSQSLSHPEGPSLFCLWCWWLDSLWLKGLGNPLRERVFFYSIVSIQKRRKSFTWSMIAASININEKT